MNLIGEMITSKSGINLVLKDFQKLFTDFQIYISNKEEEFSENDIYFEDENLFKNMENFNEILEKFIDTKTDFERLLNEMQEIVMKIRMVPISVIFSRFPKLIRDVSKELNKKINFTILGEDIELDKTIIEYLTDPLIHMLRNSIDHGIEEKKERLKKNKDEIGNILIKAYHESDNIIIEIKDDGKGLDKDKIINTAIKKNLIKKENLNEYTEDFIYSLIFEHGFSTKDEVSSLSGRGVGMEVVKQKIKEINGSIQIKTKKDKGSIFRIKLPLTLAIVQSLIVESSNQIFSIPIKNIEQTLKVEIESLKTVNNKKVIDFFGKIVPVIDLAEILEIPKKESKEKFLIIIYSNDKKVGILVDNLISKEDTVIKTIDNLSVNKNRFISSATVLGDGKVILILDVFNIILNY
jgi:two-component system chemotaxis sensor kinase CheA